MCKRSWKLHAHVPTRVRQFKIVCPVNASEFQTRILPVKLTMRFGLHVILCSFPKPPPVENWPIDRALPSIRRSNRSARSLPTFFKHRLKRSYFYYSIVAWNIVRRILPLNILLEFIVLRKRMEINWRWSRVIFIHIYRHTLRNNLILI